MTIETTRVPGAFLADGAGTSTVSSSNAIESSAVDVDNHHHEYAAYVQYGVAAGNVYVTSRKTGGSWSAKHRLLGSGVAPFNVKESVSGDGSVAVAWEQQAASGNASKADGVWVATRAAGTSTWTKRHLGTIDAYLVGVAIDSHRRTHVLWMNFGSKASTSGLLSVDNADHGHWAAPVKITGTGNKEIFGFLDGGGALTINRKTNALALVMTQEHTSSPASWSVAVATKPATTDKHPVTKWTALSARMSQADSTGAVFADGVAYGHGKIWVTVSKVLNNPDNAANGVYLLSGSSATRVGHGSRPSHNAHDDFGLPAVNADGDLSLALERFDFYLSPANQGVWLMHKTSTGWSKAKHLSDSAYDFLETLSIDSAGHTVTHWTRQ